MKINKEWHDAHRMPKNPTPVQRYEWHTEHAKHCSCREMPAGLKEKADAWKKKQAEKQKS